MRLRPGPAILFGGFLALASLSGCGRRTAVEPHSLSAAPEHATIVEDVTFRHGDNLLAGSIHRPNLPGPHPAVAFVHGSGALGRNDWTLHPPLREHLARQGIASLCWDKPGVGASTGDWTEQSFHDRAREALAAVTFLRGRADIDQKHVGLWGISQGGWICPLAASLSPDVAFIVLVSAPAGTIEEQDLYRVEQEMRGDGMPAADIEKAQAFARRRIELIRGTSFEQFDAAQREVSEERWFKDYVHRLGPRDFAFGKKNIAYDGRGVVKGVRCPVLIIVGERDRIVPAKESAVRIEENLRKAGNRYVTIKVFAEADHFIHLSQSGGPREAQAKDRVKTFAPGYLSTVTDWIGGQVRRGVIPRR
jgi:pimeloyl-ACP methyl ester carboxylesterase